MIYLLDTNICIDHLRKRGTGALRRALTRVNPNDVALCSVVLAELLAGCYQTRDPAKGFAEVHELRKLFKSLPFDDPAAEACARVNAALESQGKPIGHNDLFIAAIALANDLTVVTHNTSEFGRVPGLRTEDWQVVTP